jgi:hypothetical protein
MLADVSSLKMKNTQLQTRKMGALTILVHGETKKRQSLSSAARLSTWDPWLCAPGLLRVCSYRKSRKFALLKILMQDPCLHAGRLMHFALVIHKKIAATEYDGEVFKQGGCKSIASFTPETILSSHA